VLEELSKSGLETEEGRVRVREAQSGCRCKIDRALTLRELGENKRYVFTFIRREDEERKEDTISNQSNEKNMIISIKEKKKTSPNQ